MISMDNPLKYRTTRTLLGDQILQFSAAYTVLSSKPLVLFSSSTIRRGVWYTRS